jgi:membrane-bound metal-dependent hydrolase YbcI (DUF457 family)
MMSGGSTIPARRRNAALAGMIAIILAGLATVAWVALPTQQGFVALAVIIIVGALAIWKRPPTRDATGRRIRPTTVVNTVLAVGMIAIPIGIAAVGLIGGRSAAPLVLGIGFAEFGFEVFALYSLAWAVTRRAKLAASLALVVAGIAATWLSVPAFLDQLAGRNPF